MFKKNISSLSIILLAITLVVCAAPAPPQSRQPPPNPPANKTSPTTMPLTTPLPKTTSSAEVSSSTTPTGANSTASFAYPIVDTGQGQCYDANGAASACSAANSALFGQDAQYTGNIPHYTDNGDGTISDNVTGLMWQKSPDSNSDGRLTAADKLTYDAALARAKTMNLGGYTDWRLPTIKELYSLIRFDGTDPSGPPGNAVTVIPFIDTAYFDFAYGDTSAGERTIDSQYASSTKYVSTTMHGAETMFGVNFADGRIKGYPTGPMPGNTESKGFFVLYVRGNPNYGQNSFVDNGNSTITDNATGLMWQQNDSGAGLNWADALAYCQNLTTAGYDDWRLPNAKELQSIVDYSRSPDTTNSAAINPLFKVTAITNEAGHTDYPAFWSSTTHANIADGLNAAYVAFGRAMGYMNNTWLDVHGAGAQRSDPKAGDPANYPTGHGPQGDAIRIYNYARCVRGGNVALTPMGDSAAGRTGVIIESTGSNQSAQPATDNQLPGVIPGQPNGPGGQPPQEAIAACSGQSQGASCQFTIPHGLVIGTCTLIQEQLACVPAIGSPGNAPSPHP